jgi:hypothetical protein
VNYKKEDYPGLGNHQKARLSLEGIGVVVIALWDHPHLFFPSPLNDNNVHTFPPRRHQCLLWHPFPKVYAHFIGTFSNIKSVTTNWVRQDSSKKIKNIVLHAAQPHDLITVLYMFETFRRKIMITKWNQASSVHDNVISETTHPNLKNQNLREINFDF